MTAVAAGVSDAVADGLVVCEVAAGRPAGVLEHPARSAATVRRDREVALRTCFQNREIWLNRG